MSEFIAEKIAYFAYLSGIIGYFRENISEIRIMFIILGIAMCVGGFWLYRYIVAGITFFFVSTGIILMLGDNVSWGITVTTFSVLGVIIAFLIYEKKHFNAVIINVLLSGILSYTCADSLVLVVAVMILAAFITICVPVEAVCVLTAISGIVLLGENLSGLDIWKKILFGIIAVAFQIVLSMNQKSIEPRYPNLIEKTIMKWRKKNDPSA